MNEIDARNALLIRAFETGAASGHWDEEDREWASRSAAQVEGEKASAQAFVARRAGLATERLSSRVPAVAATLSSVSWKPWAGWLLIAAALLAGLALDAVSAKKGINILAPPILAILVWNLAVYLLLVGRGVWRAARPTAERTAGAAAAPRPLQRLISRVVHGIPKPLLKPKAAAPLAVFVRHWAHESAALNAGRTMSVLHYAAAAFAIGALGGLYTRGLAFEYLAGWESTFLNVATVRGLLDLVLGPASLLTGIALPDTARLEAIRLPAGTGENAAGWIHLYAVTVLLFVVLPRIALGLFESVHARRWAARFPIALTDGYFRNLRRQHRGDSAQVQVIPYSYQLSVEGRRGIKRLMQQVYGPETLVTVSPTVALGGEDQLSVVAGPPTPVALTVALFSLSATPEAENHAAFVAALAGALAADAVIVALVDEAPFTRRFGANSARLGDRRATWRRILATRIDIEPVFLSLEADDLSAARRNLSEVLDEVTGRMVQNTRFSAAAKASALAPKYLYEK